ncbi:MAG TPA: universal stress protein [Polyangia bacterium]|nr:universal stress protein [Polyangia bacterium]
MFKRILLATDFSENADAALAVAIDLALHGPRTLEIVHAYRAGVIVLPPPLDLIGLPTGGPTLDDLQRGLEQRVQQARDKGLHVTSRELVGDPSAEIVSHAREHKADLIVLGGRGLGLVAHALLGSVAAKVVRHAPCPVLVVPHAT